MTKRKNLTSQLGAQAWMAESLERIAKVMEEDHAFRKQFEPAAKQQIFGPAGTTIDLKEKIIAKVAEFEAPEGEDVWDYLESVLNDVGNTISIRGFMAVLKQTVQPRKPDQDRLTELHQWAMGYIGDNEALLDRVDDLGYAVGAAAACDWLMEVNSVLTEEVDRLMEIEER